MTPCIYWLSGSYTPRIAKVGLELYEAVSGKGILAHSEMIKQLLNIIAIFARNPAHAIATATATSTATADVTVKINIKNEVKGFEGD